MESKKDLNNTQRKVLEEIYCQQVTTIINDYKRNRSVERERFVEDTLDKIKKTSKGKAVQSAIDKLGTAVEEAKQFFKEQGVSQYTFRNIGDLQIKLEDSYRYNDIKNADVRAFDEETVFTEERYDKVRQEVRAKIWGMDTTYAEIESEVKSVLASIKI